MTKFYLTHIIMPSDEELLSGKKPQRQSYPLNYAKTTAVARKDARDAMEEIDIAPADYCVLSDEKLNSIQTLKRPEK